jgi:hypothetical protein
MQDLDSYQVFCALELLKSKQRQRSATNQNHNDEDEVVCACAKYLEETL